MVPSALRCERNHDNQKQIILKWNIDWWKSLPSWWPSTWPNLLFISTQKNDFWRLRCICNSYLPAFKSFPERYCSTTRVRDSSNPFLQELEYEIVVASETIRWTSASSNHSPIACMQFLIPDYFWYGVASFLTIGIWNGESRRYLVEVWDYWFGSAQPEYCLQGW